MTPIEELTKSVHELNQQFDILLENIHCKIDIDACPICLEPYNNEDHMETLDNPGGPCLACSLEMEDGNNANEIHREFNYE